MNMDKKYKRKFQKLTTQNGKLKNQIKKLKQELADI